MRLAAAVVTLGLVAAGCGGDDLTGGTRSDAKVASVSIVTPPADHNLHVGDTYRLRAEVRDENGNPLDRDVTWFAYPASIYPPPIASVSANGLLTIESPMIFSADVEAVVDGASDQEHMIFRGWGFEEGFFPGTRDIFARAHLSGNLGPDGPPRLNIRCERGELSLFVGAPFRFGSHLVRYRIDGGAERSEEWEESTELQALVFPEDPAPLVAGLSLADTVTFTLEDALGEPLNTTFIPKGLQSFVEALFPPCGSIELRSR